MATGSLVVRISADINDFSRQLKAMTKGVDEAAKKVSEVGKALSIGLTVPLVAAAAAMTKFGMDQAATSAKFGRELGPAAAAVSAQFERITKVVPVTTSALKGLANTMDQFGRGVGMAAPQAALFAGEATKMAAVLKQATPGATLEAAGEALERGFEGSTKGLKSFGINIDAVQVKQEAYRLGLLKIGNELTPLGTSLATYSLLTKQLSTLQGEAVGVQQDVATQWQFLKAQATELAESVGLKLLPKFSSLIEVGRGVIAVLTELPDWMKEGAIYAGMFAAAIGPLLIGIVGTASAIVKLKAAFDLLKGVELIEKIGSMVTGWQAAAVALAVVAVAVIGIAVAWEYFKKKGQEAASAADDILKKFAGAKSLIAAGGPGPTSVNTKDPLQQFQQQASAVTSAYEDAIKVGDGLTEPFARVVALNQQALALYSQQSDKLSQMALAARRVALETKALIDVKSVASALYSGFGSTGAAKQAIGGAAMTPADIHLSVASSRIGDENQLLMREAALKAKDTFDAVRVAGVNLAEKFLQVSHDFSVGFATFKKQWSSAGSIGTSALSGLKEGALSVLQGFTPMGLAAMAIGKVMQGLQPVIDKLMGPLVALGQILAEIVQPLLKPLFMSMKGLGIAVALVGEVIYTVAGGIAKAIGGLISAIGSFIRKIPFLGGIGKDIQNFGNSISNLGNSALDTAKQLDHSRIQLQNLGFDDAANGLDSLTNSANAAAESLTEVPQAFKIALRRFQATAPSDPSLYTPPGASPPTSPPPAAPPPSGGGGYPGGGEDPNNPAAFNIILDGQKVGQLVLNRFRSSASRQLGDANAFPNLVRIN